HLAMEEAHGFSAEALTLYFLRHNLQRTTVRTPQQSAELLRWVVATGNDIAAERRWTPCAGDHCGGCDFRSVCPAHTGAPLKPLQIEPARGQMSLLLPGADEPSAVTASALDGDAEGQLALPLG
ncbi:MAG TPA: PD-(D/E)XK nuclease family protein, partial [Armatimonadota bacterium]|nr:PD-(D/E)XK nuclease family protein [Armatimonadota bacterium]